MTNTVSHKCGFPDTTNTGIPAGTALKHVPGDITAPDATTGSGWHWDARGWLAADTKNAVVKNVIVAGDVNVTATGVTVQHVRVDGSFGGFGVALRHANGAIVEDNEIHGADGGSGRLLTGIKDIYGDSQNVKMLRNNIYYTSTAIQIGQGLIQDNYIHDMGYVSGDHINGTTSDGSTTLLTIRHNTIFNQFGQTDAVSLFQDFGDQANRVIDDNLLAGGGYALYAGAPSPSCTSYNNTQGCYGPSSNIQVTNNHFSRLFHPNCGGYGPVAYFNASGSGNVWSANIWDDTGAAVTP